MTTPLAVPAPRGDLATVTAAASAFNGYAGTVAGQIDEFDRIVAHLDGAWAGAAATSFVGQQAIARAALENISRVSADVAGVMDDYAIAWRTAHEASSDAYRAIDAALQTYGYAAQAVIGRLIGSLEWLLDNPVTEFLSGIGSDLASFVGRLRSWTPPAQRPIIVELQENGTIPRIDTATVLDFVRGAADFGISHLLRGIEFVAELVGGAIGWAFDAFHRVEVAFAEAVSAAHATVQAALDALRVAGEVSTVLVSAAARQLGDVVYRYLAAAFPGVVAMGGRLRWSWQNRVELAEIAASVLVLLDKHRKGLGDGRRWDPELAKKADRAARRRLRRDPEYQRDVDTHLRLADAAYGGRMPYGTEGWRKAETFGGPDGFSATVFVSRDGKVVLSYRGTNPEEMSDIAQDAMNAAGLVTTQGKRAVEVAKQVVEEYGKRYGTKNISFTGHSLGGSLAAMGSHATGRPSITFNAAGVGDGNYDMARDAGGKCVPEDRITNVHLATDVVTRGQNGFGVTPASGVQISLPSGVTALRESHELETIYEAFAGFGYEQADPRWK